MLQDMRTISESSYLPFRIVETNSIFNEGQPGVSDAFGSALWGLDFMFQVAEAGGGGVNFHTGDVKAYTPIGPGPDGHHMARPLYYGMLMFKEAGRSAVLVPVQTHGGRLKYGGLRYKGCRWHAEGMSDQQGS